MASLSAGEKRRAAIAGILALDRPFLFLDEPTAGLDPASRESVAGLIVSERARRGILVVTHDLDLADRVAERTIVLSDGAVIADGKTSSVLSDVGFIGGVGLEPPARYALIAKIRERAPEAADRAAGFLVSGRLADGEPE